MSARKQRSSDFWEEHPTKERWTRKRKKPQGRRRFSQIKGDGSDKQDDCIQFLIGQGHLTEVITELKSGKEATAFIARSSKGIALVKLYHDMAARSFQNDAIYRGGQMVLDERAKRAMSNRSKKGLEMLQAQWVCAEYAHLWRLWQAGLPVPEPLVGPSSKDYAVTVPAVLMRLIGTEDAPAPRLSDVRLNPEQAQSAWQQSLDGMAALLRLGYVHGDYSTYNLLWWENTMFMIDFPQMSTKQNPNFQELLQRDAASLSKSFRRHGIAETAEQTLREVQRRALGPAPEPRVLLP